MTRSFFLTSFAGFILFHSLMRPSFTLSMSSTTPSERSTSTPKRGPPCVFFTVTLNSSLTVPARDWPSAAGEAAGFTVSSSMGDMFGRGAASPAEPSLASWPAQHFAPMATDQG
eukprot:CAMPEP_0168407362 /NCGR_PEP_ID=MMETSP0228-20121227/26122_1 /TAXON_ID=133427 /ORGANISM="Protoceratium reticulatum, Strain CCCM 535 (=CCMP 1889)" /LENGTH=113 /DNA_ID=CAMNT_0008421027 /DNA_START=371 /DNA_END=712 /DNA_ORIENTATION=-